MQPTIKDLRQKGYKVRVMHKRNYIKRARMFSEHGELSARGGSTTIELTTPDKQHTVFGEAMCSHEDNFDHKVGNSIALGRALKQLDVVLSNANS